MGRERGQVLMTLILQQFKKPLLIARQPIRFQALEFREEIMRASQCRVEVCSVSRPLPFEGAEPIDDGRFTCMNVRAHRLNFVGQLLHNGRGRFIKVIE